MRGMAALLPDVADERFFFDDENVPLDDVAHCNTVIILATFHTFSARSEICFVPNLVDVTRVENMLRYRHIYKSCRVASYYMI